MLNRSKFLKVLVATILTGTCLTGCVGGNTTTNNTAEEKTEQTDKKEESGPEKTTEIVFTSWANTGEIAVLKKAVDIFNEKQSEIKVVYQNAPGEGYEQKLITSLAGGTAADVFYAGDQTISKLIQNGTIIELTDFLDTDKSYCKAEDFSEGLWGAAKQGNKIYGLPVDCNPLVMYYSPTMFEELGIKSPQVYFDEGNWNWDTFDEVTQQLVDKDKKGYILERDSSLVNTWIFQNGGSMWDGETYKLDDKAVETLEWLDKGLEEARFTYASSLPKGQGADASFLSKQVGFVTAGRWLTPTFYEAKMDMDYIPFPTNTGNKTEKAFIATAYMSVNAKSKNLEAAKEFASFYCSIDGQSARLGGVGNAIPSINGIDNIVLESNVPVHGQYIFDARAIGITSGSPGMRESVYPGLNDKLKDAFDEIFVNNKPVSEMAPKMEEVSNKLIEEVGK